MKRIFALLLSFVLLLSGCAAQPKDDSTTPTAPAFSVKTDYSNYAPPEHYNPAFGGIGVTELIPRDDYGTIYPFVGENYKELNINLYGFIDEAGKVIVDPVYLSVDFCGGKDGGVWCLGKLDNANADDYSYADCLYAIATGDGSRVTEFRYSFVEVCEDLVVAAEDAEMLDEYYNKAYVFRYDIYDLELNLLTTSEELLKDKPELCRSLSNISYAEGMFLLSFGQEYSEDWPEQAYYIERESSRMLGPYNRGYDFAQGYAIVDSYDRRGRSYMDKQGNFIEGEFSAEWNFEHGIALVSNYEDGRFTCDAVIDETGRMLLACDYGEDISIENGCIVYKRDWDVGLTAYYNFEGELLYPEFHPYGEDDGWAGHIPEAWRHLGDGLFCDTEEGKLFNILDGKVYLEGIRNPDSPGIYRMEELPYYIINIGKTAYEQHVYSLDFEEIMTMPGNDYNCRTDPFTGEIYFCIEPYETGTLWIYNKDMELCLKMPWKPNDYTHAIYDGRIMYQNELGCMYFDTQGNKIYDYPFVSNDG